MFRYIQDYLKRVYVMLRLTAFLTVNSCDARLMVASRHPQSACNLITSFY